MIGSRNHLYETVMQDPNKHNYPVASTRRLTKLWFWCRHTACGHVAPTVSTGNSCLSMLNINTHAIVFGPTPLNLGAGALNAGVWPPVWQLISLHYA
jgi:hypothetical protein